jgi:hypothetical protein
MFPTRLKRFFFLWILLLVGVSPLTAQNSSHQFEVYQMRTVPDGYVVRGLSVFGGRLWVEIELEAAAPNQVGTRGTILQSYDLADLDVPPLEIEIAGSGIVGYEDVIVYQEEGRSLTLARLPNLEVIDRLDIPSPASEQHIRFIPESDLLAYPLGIYIGLYNWKQGTSHRLDSRGALLDLAVGTDGQRFLSLTTQELVLWEVSTQTRLVEQRLLSESYQHALIVNPLAGVHQALMAEPR